MLLLLLLPLLIEVLVQIRVVAPQPQKLQLLARLLPQRLQQPSKYAEVKFYGKGIIATTNGNMSGGTLNTTICQGYHYPSEHMLLAVLAMVTGFDLYVEEAAW